jgi:hypothetical protein
MKLKQLFLHAVSLFRKDSARNREWPTDDYIIKVRSPSPKRLSTKTLLMIVLAVLGALATIFSGSGSHVIDVIRNSRGKPEPIKVSKPVVIYQETEKTAYGYTSPPKIQVTAQSHNPFTTDTIFANCGKLRSGSEFQVVPPQNFSVEQRDQGHMMVTTLNTNSFIHSLNTDSPHGWYKAIFKITDPARDNNSSTELEFNYVYKEGFRHLEKVLIPETRGFTNVPENGGGLSVHNLRKGQGYVSALLKQKFDFKTNFCITGFFTVLSKDTTRPTGLDIALCDRWGEKLSFVFADGHFDAFSIKVMRDKYGKGETTNRNYKNGPRIIPSTDANMIPNFFKIEMVNFNNQSRCRLYVKQYDSDFDPNSIAHERFISTSVFAGTFTTINFKLWQSGIVKLYDFEVAELPKPE